jgi:hypothetical protein
MLECMRLRGKHAASSKSGSSCTYIGQFGVGMSAQRQAVSALPERPNCRVQYPRPMALGSVQPFGLPGWRLVPGRNATYGCRCISQATLRL